MNQLVTEAIVLSRTNFGEADRVIKLITPDSGKLSMVARGVRKQKSKLAGGIELFSVSNLTYIKGRGELGTLISARLEKHFGDIVKHIDRVQLGYELIKQLDRATEDEPEAEYFHLLLASFEALNDATINAGMVQYWFKAQLLQMAGYTPNLSTDASGEKLQAGNRYSFDFDAVLFNEHPSGQFTTDHIKFLRLVFAGNAPKTLQQVNGSGQLLEDTVPLMQTMLTSYIRV